MNKLQNVDSIDYLNVRCVSNIVFDIGLEVIGGLQCMNEIIFSIAR